MEKLIESELKLGSEFLAKVVIRLMKKDIFERFIKSGTLSKEDQEFCDKIGWYPIDELELKEEYAKKIKELERGQHLSMTIKKLDKLTGFK